MHMYMYKAIVCAVLLLLVGLVLELASIDRLYLLCIYYICVKCSNFKLLLSLDCVLVVSQEQNKALKHVNL